MANIKKVMEWNTRGNLEDVAEALVGQDDNFRSHPGISGLILDKEVDGRWQTIGNTCNRDDLCCDGDAIVLAKRLEDGDGTNSHLLSSTLRNYYNDTAALADRFKQIGWSVGATNESDAADIFFSQVTGLKNDGFRKMLDGGATEEVVDAACKALAKFVF
ncbi:hypothetical protein Jden_1978 [Jonesia denitrificans DSM 20603]|uniref:Uncharacterized protein n=2 Tax=Jonesia TaxID=43673 RepID=C7R0F3_JONDD|nr:hypothetical protein Jden_1978 [Jonesia denitrificans DSM 20603]ASE09159.1 hypothetical protein CEP80_08410 [Jonesia denitrificans]